MKRAAAVCTLILGSLAACTIDPEIYQRLFENNRPMFMKIRLRVVDAGATAVLDLGTGLGEPALSIAEALPQAEVMATDIQPAMLEKAKARATGVTNIKFKEASADDLSHFPDNAFDAVTACYVLMFVPDRRKAMREIGRVLRPGGSAYVAVWQDLEMVTLILAALEEVAGGPPPPLQTNPLALSAPNAVEDLVGDPEVPLEVEAVQLVDYPMKLGDSNAVCQSAKMLAGPSLSKLAEQGHVDAPERFCAAYVAKMEAAGAELADGTFEQSRNVARLLTLRKPGRAEL